MKDKEKEAEMQKFVSGQTQILVATTVIEVGVNVPNASVMVILDARCLDFLSSISCVVVLVVVLNRVIVSLLPTTN